MTQAKRTMKVAVIEDNAELRGLTLELLSRHGFRAFGYEDAESVFEEEFVPNLYVVDINLPDMNGYDLIARIRKGDKGAGIVVLSARTGDDDISRGYEVGADVFLCKPTAPMVLLAAVKRLSDKRVDTTNEGIKLNMDRSVISFEGNEKLLLVAECNLLLKLSFADKEGLPYWAVGELLGLDIDSDFRTILEVRIARLRNKLAAVGCERQCLRATRSFGYVLTQGLTID